MFGGYVGEVMDGWIRRNVLVQNTCWEDPIANLAALELTSSHRIFMVTSAGCNAFDYALAGPSRIDAVDPNLRQTALLELKIAGIRTLEFDDFFRMFGAGHWRDAPRVYAQSLRQHLSAASASIWDRSIARFADPRRPFYFRGATGTFTRLVNFYVQRVLRLRDAMEDLLSACTIEEQQWIYEQRVRERLWTSGIRFAMQRNAALSLVGLSPGQRWQIERDYRTGVVGYIKDRLERVVANHLLANNHFWRVYLTGRYTPNCCPSYLQPENFERLKAGTVDRIHAHTNTPAGFLRNCDRRYTHFILLDHFDNLSLSHQEQLQADWQEIVWHAAHHARCLWRSGGVHTDFVDELAVRRRSILCQLGELLNYQRQLQWTLGKLDRAGAYASLFVADLAT